MKIFAISDLHLSFGTPEKSMNKFGWEDHYVKIKEDWLRKVDKDDLILLPGDLSWALKLDDALADLDFLGNLPGKKFLLKGNHDYWWTSLKKLNDYFLSKNYEIYPVQYNSYKINNIIISGLRGWEYPLKEQENYEENLKKYNKELARFDLSLNSIKNKIALGDKVIFMMHYPPFTSETENTPLTEKIISQKEIIKTVVFGHLHSVKNPKFYNRKIKGIEFKLTSCDATDFKLTELEI